MGGDSSLASRRPIILPKSFPRPVQLRPKRGPIRHSEKEWEAIYPHVKRMYVVERHKLRYVMEKLEKEHDFKTTQQTFKKRLAQWGFFKNTRATSSLHCHSSSSEADTTVQHVDINVTSCSSMHFYESHHECFWPYRLSSPTSPRFNTEEAARFELLSSIYDWSTSFYEHVNLMPESDFTAGFVAVPPWGLGVTYDPEGLSSSFRLITLLLQMGEGMWAGRLARTAFLQIESILHVEGPVFVWNLMEVIWTLLRNEQVQLARMLFVHLFRLARDFYPSRHPLLRILRNLEELTRILRTEQDRKPYLEAVQQGWALNADLLFSPPNPRLLLLYYRIVWDSDLIQLPPGALTAADKLYAEIKENVPAGPSVAAGYEVMMGNDNAVVSDKHAATYRLNEAGGQLPQNYSSLIGSSLSEVHELVSIEPDGSFQKFRALSALLKSRVFEDDAPSSQVSQQDENSHFISFQQQDSRIKKLRARTLALVMTVIMEAETRRGLNVDILIRRRRDIISLRQYGQHPTAPQVIIELQQLEDLLLQDNQEEEAKIIRQDYFQRLERYVNDIPLHSVQ